MPNQLAKKGAQPSRPIRYAPIWTNRMATGIWTQRSPLRDAASTRIEEEFYGARGDALIDGLNTEVSSALTFIRRPGLSVYNSQTFPPINRFYENRVSIYNGTQTELSESIQMIADGQDGVIYDCTGPSTKKALFTKSAGAGKTSFQGVGNTLYFSDGPDQKKLLTPNKIWAANQTFQSGDLILDSNGNIQQAQSATTLDVSTVQVYSTVITIPPSTHITIWKLRVTFTDTVTWTVGQNVTFQGLTNFTLLNGLTLPIENVFGTYAEFGWTLTTVIYGPAPDTGTGSTGGSGTLTTGAVQPAWNITVGGTTTDNTVLWQNFGSNIYNWGLATPTTAPTLTSDPNARQWSASKSLSLWYSIMDSNNNVQAILSSTSSPYTTGSTTPNWGGTSASVPTLQTLTVGGTPGTYSASPNLTKDGSIYWTNCGNPLRWYSATSYPLFQCIVDSNGNWQILTSSTAAAGSPPTTGATEPTWGTTVGSVTSPDGNCTWVNVGPGTILVTGEVQYAYSYHSVDGSVSTASPLTYQNLASAIVGSQASYRAALSGATIADDQVDQIWLWRTVQGGSTLLLLTTIPNPSVGTATTWSYTDYLPDTSLNSLITGPVAGANDPPPVGITALTYHVGRLWGAVGNIAYSSGGPDVSAGNGNTAWNPLDFYEYPSSVTRMDPTSYGLTVYTLSDPYLIQGLGTTSSPFFSIPFLKRLGLVSYDAFAVNGGIAYMYTSDNQLVALDPNGGVSEIGFPIGDQFGPSYGTGTFTPTSTQVTWHVASSPDKGLYVSDSQGTWWRLCPTPAPEQGLTWSPKAQPIGGFSCVQSCETVPGTYDLLVAPKTSGPILKRDSSVYSDNGSAYNAWLILGSLVLAQPGQHALVDFFTTDAWKRGSALTLAIQLDEIAPVGSGYFETLNSLDGSGNIIPDPPTLVEPNSIYAQRFYVSQTQQPAWCRHLQVQVNFGTDTVKNELLSITLYGGWDAEK